jgi:hypothetical protein
MGAHLFFENQRGDNNPLNMSVLRLLQSALLMFIAAWLFAQSVELISSYFIFDSGFFADGQFQLLNALRQIHDGHAFEYFHGKGIPYVHYPLYKFTGTNLFSLEFSRFTVSLLAFLIAGVLVALAASRNITQRLFVLGVIVLFSPLYPGLYMPGNSSLGLRTLFPMIVFAATLSGGNTIGKAAVLGLLLSLGLIMGAEHGLAMLAAFFLTAIVLLIVQREQVTVSDMGKLIALVAAFSASFCLLLVLLSGSVEGAMTTFRYNFREVVADQVWYFGSPPNSFVDAPRDLANPWLLGCVLPGCGLLFYLLRKISTSSHGGFSLFTSRYVALFIVMLYGLFTLASYLISYTVIHHLGPGLRVLVTVGAITLLDIVHNNDKLRATVRNLLHRRLTREVSLSLLLAVFVGIYSIPLTSAAMTKLRQIAQTEFKQQLSGRWPSYLGGTTRIFDPVFLHRPTTPQRSRTIWSTYSGVLHERYDLHNPAEPYIILALGEKRRRDYSKTFAEVRPRYVETMRRDRFFYEEWLINNHWSFYEPLLKNYKFMLLTGHSLFWELSDAEWRSTTGACQRFEVNAGSFTIPAQFRDGGEAFKAITVSLSYKTSNLWGRVPVIGRMPRYLVEQRGTLFRTPISLPPDREHHEFPLFFHTGQIPQLDFSVRSLSPGASLTVDSVCIRASDLNSAQIRSIL